MTISEAKTLLQKPVFGDSRHIAARDLLAIAEEYESLRKRLVGHSLNCADCGGTGTVRCCACNGSGETELGAVDESADAAFLKHDLECARAAVQDMEANNPDDN